MSAMIPMRRKDREVTDFDTAVRIVDRCDILRLGLADGDYPYIVPVNFAYTADHGQLVFYIHGAMAGRKYELLKKNPACSFELDYDLGLKLMPDHKDVTTRYASVMGAATAEFLEGEERQRAIDEIIMARYEGLRNFEYNRPNVPHTAVIRLTVTDWSAKSNLKGEADL